VSGESPSIVVVDGQLKKKKKKKRKKKEREKEKLN